VRVAVIVATFLATVAAAAIVVLRTADDAALATGRDLYAHRSILGQIRDAAAWAVPPAVVWMGDSTLMEFPGLPSHASLVERRVLAPAGEQSLVLAAPNVDFYAYWHLAGRIAALRPELVVLVANLRTLAPTGGPKKLGDLTGEVDLADIPATLALPFYLRGMTAPGLLLARTLRTEAGEGAFLRLEGARRNAQEADVWRRLGPEHAPVAPGELFARYVAADDDRLAAYDRPLAESSPLLDYVRASVGRLVRDGIAVLVIVTPMPWERAATVGRYAPARAASRIDVLRDAVEAAGGRLVDLHRTLLAAEFRDADCHLTPEGAARVAALLAPDVERILAARGRLRRPVPTAAGDQKQTALSFGATK
jgi:hypothetical protein